jgi:hypothetical protein
MEINVFEIEPGRWGYSVGGVYQEYHPDLAGYVAMDEQTARQQAALVAARMGAA